MVSTGAINADPKTALASRFAMKARADNKFSRKRSRRLGGSPAAHGSTDERRVETASPKAASVTPYSPGRVANTAGDESTNYPTA